MSSPLTSSTKFFIGNLPYSITSTEIESLLVNYKDQIKSIEIPSVTRKNKTSGEETVTSKGYALIEFNDETSIDAPAFIEFVNSSNLSDRQLFGKIAYTEEQLEQKKLEKAERVKTQKKAKKETAKKEKKKVETSASEVTEANGEEEPKPKVTKSKKTNNNTTTPRVSSPPKRKTKEEKVKKLEEGIPSKNTVFIGNLDELVTPKDLNELFEGYSPVYIKVPKKILSTSLYKFLRSKDVQIKNTGVAFAKFEDEETQQKVIKDFNEKEFKGKVLNVTVAIDSKLPEEKEN